VEVARRGATDPVLAGAVPAAQELQRRLVASRDRAFQVAVYLTITARTREELAGATSDVEAAARGALCTLRLCHYTPADGRLARAVNGVDVPLALGSGHALNVLEPKPPGAEESWLGPAVADALDLVNVICGSLDEVERALTEAAIRDAYSAADHPVLRDVAAHLPPSSRPARILQRWVGGSLGAMFSSPTNVDLDAPLVVFGMRELREEMVGAVH